MILTDGVVRLRPWRAGDAASIHCVLEDPRIRRFSTISGGVAEWLRAQDDERRISLAITEVTEDRAVGRVSLRLADRELGYWLVPAARGRGLATRAARLLADHGLVALGMPDVKLEIEHDNQPSLRVAQALGASPTGQTRTEHDRDGVSRRLVVFRIV